MVLVKTPETLSEVDQRLIAALQCQGRLTAERAGEVLGLSTRSVHRRWSALINDGTVRVLAARPRSRSMGAMMLRIRVLRGKVDMIAAALAKRDDIPFIDVSAGGDEISAVLMSGSGPDNRLVFQQLPATGSVTSVTAHTVLHVFSTAADWRLDVLTTAERAALSLPAPDPSTEPGRPLDATDEAIAAVLEEDGRLPAATIAARTGQPESTVRRRLAALFARRRLRTQVVVDARRLGLGVDANIWIEVPPDRLDETGRRWPVIRPYTELWPPPAPRTSVSPSGSGTRRTSTATYTAVSGQGAYRDGRPVEPSRKTDLSLCLIGTSQPPTISSDPRATAGAGRSLSAVLPFAGAVRNLGPTSWQVADTAAGRMDAFWEFGLDDSNLLGGALVAAEAGILVTDTEGRPWRAGAGSFLAAPAALHQRLVKILNVRS
ncbi:inositol monophosphatase family protein [Streptomyces sp. AK02-01A]|uniref:inositol monophosphatase family protein n=1 Tax=Streptomyces sp. AK02-01A TaxID=3028648 RepID=UPI0029BAC100|nr:inositol monophosphatase family protein [Streptomyces sp. AK02-01A]MDX3850754.1 AsnC family transcriptional regulator [Streptomyces sp. AK02-01A]